MTSASSIASTVARSISVLCLIALTSCGGTSSASKSDKNLYTSFYSGEEGMQYFIKPLAFIGPDKSELMVDCSFRYKKELTQNVRLSMSILNDEVVKEVTSVMIKNTSGNSTSTDIELLFNEQRKGGYESRFIVMVPLAEFQPLFAHADWEIVMETNKGSLTFVGSKKTQGNIRSLNAGLFSIVD